MKQMEQAARLMQLLTERGAEGAQVHIKGKELHSLSMTAGEIDTLATERSSTAVLKLRRGIRFAEKSYSFGTEEELPAIAAAAVAELEGAPEDADEDIFPAAETGFFSDLRSSYDPAAMQRCLLRLLEDTAAVGAVLKRASLSYEVRREALVSTNGTAYRYEADGYRISYAAVLERDGKTIDPFRNHADFRAPEEFRFPKEDLLTLHAPLLFAPKKSEPFIGSLLIAPNALYYLLMDHLFGQLFEGSLLAGGSAWSNRFDRQVCSPAFSAAMDPFHPGIVFGERITQDGCRAEGYELIRNGILKNAIAGQKPARLLGIPASGNTADNLVLPAGSAPLSQLLRSVDRGVLVFSFSGDGNPDGSFSGVAATGFLIENGKITAALEDCPISGNWFTILSGEDFAFSRERVCNGEFVLPWMKINRFSFS